MFQFTFANLIEIIIIKLLDKFPRLNCLIKDFPRLLIYKLIILSIQEKAKLFREIVKQCHASRVFFYFHV